MHLNGVLRTWNEDRGFGFIEPAHGGSKVFVHISAFSRGGTHPTVGEKLSYELGRGKNGKPQAVRALRMAFGERAGTSSPRANPLPTTVSWLGSLLIVALLVGAGTYGLSRNKAYERRLALENLPVAPSTAPVESGMATSLLCDGRTMCSQMTSCAEAKWFINNCPGTRMDGNHDGTPCEQQWCTGPFAK